MERMRNMAKAKKADPYHKLLRVMLILLVLFVAFATAFFWLDKYQKASYDERAQQVEEKNKAIIEEYNLAVAEQKRSAQQPGGAALERPVPQAQGLEVLDLSDFPVELGTDVTVTRNDMLMGGLLLLNRWHALPGDFINVEENLKSVMSETNFRVPVHDNKVVLFQPAVAALDAFIADAKEAGYEHYIVREGYRTMEEQTISWRNEEQKHAGKYTDDALMEITRRQVSYPGTSDYQSGMSFRMAVYNKNDAALNRTRFFETEQSTYLYENCWKYGIVFRFPVGGYPVPEAPDKTHITGISLKMDAYRYVGKPHAAAMQAMGFCLEEYIDYLIEHPHIGVYEDGELKYEIYRQQGGYQDTEINIPPNAVEYVISTDNMNGMIVSVTY
jgi:LAS superfamily LD-carboxypeptidase LdcB